MRLISRWLFLIWIPLFCFVTACNKSSSKPQLEAKLELFAQLRQQGDGEFAKMHWNGWEKAAGYYEASLVRRDDPELRQRLFTTYILLSLRETEMFFRNESWLQKAESLLPKVPAAPFCFQLAMAREKMRQISFFRGGYTTLGAPELEKTPMPRDTSSALSSYLYLIFLRLITTRDTTAEYIEAEKQFQQLHGNSNLAVFSRTYTPEEMAEKLTSFPDFAEMYMLRGDGYRAKKNIRRRWQITSGPWR